MHSSVSQCFSTGTKLVLVIARTAGLSACLIGLDLLYGGHALLLPSVRSFPSLQPQEACASAGHLSLHLHRRS